jgi:hypothetical protein
MQATPETISSTILQIADCLTFEGLENIKITIAATVMSYEQNADLCRLLAERQTILTENVKESKK